MVEPCPQPVPQTALGYLGQLSSLTLLDRIPTPMIALGTDGATIYTNSACAELLGYDDNTALAAQPLPALMADHADTSPRDCAARLASAEGSVTGWRHAAGFVVHTIVSGSLLEGADDPVLLVGMTDVSAFIWTSAPPMSEVEVA
jgi:PAS domain-containing protein